MRFSLMAFLFLFGASVFGEEVDSGNYAEEAKSLETNLSENGLDAATLYNLGNARYHLGEYGPAILAYERALLLEPRANDIRANLALARDAAAAFDESQPPAWEAPLYWLGFDEWLMVGAGALVLLAILSLVKGFGFPDRRVRALRVLSIVAIILLFASIAAVSLRQSELDRAIVLNPGTSVRLSPFETAEVVSTLQAGRPVHVEKEHDGYYRIDGGWVSKGDAELVFPRKVGS